MATETASAPSIALPQSPRYSPQRDVRAVKVMVLRELMRVARSRARMLSTLTQPILYLFVLGTGLSAMLAADGSSINLRTFMFPGVIAMSILLTSSLSAGNLVWEREFGFMREMLVAPVSRAAILLGKCLGGAVLATLQAMVIMALAGLVGVPYSPTLLLTLIGEAFLAAFAVTAATVTVAASLKSMQSFYAIQQTSLMPIIFLSGTIFPLSHLPTWLAFLTRIDPGSYIVDVLRRTVSSHLPAASRLAMARRAGTGITWDGWRVPTYVELLLVAALGVVTLTVAIISFSRTE